MTLKTHNRQKVCLNLSEKAHIFGQTFMPSN